MISMLLARTRLPVLLTALFLAVATPAQVACPGCNPAAPERSSSLAGCISVTGYVAIKASGWCWQNVPEWYCRPHDYWQGCSWSGSLQICRINNTYCYPSYYFLDQQGEAHSIGWEECVTIPVSFTKQCTAGENPAWGTAPITLYADEERTQTAGHITLPCTFCGNGTIGDPDSWDDKLTPGQRKALEIVSAEWWPMLAVMPQLAPEIIKAKDQFMQSAVFQRL